MPGPSFPSLAGSAARCRLLVHEPAAGSWNMAVDEALQLGVTAKSPLTLRFYGWTPGTLSLGYFQSLAERGQHAASADCPITRRLSGGGAILHDRELTYSIVVPQGHPWNKDLQSLYDLFHQTLIETFAAWQVTAVQCTAPVVLPPADEPFLCFERRALGDVLVDGWKICGSAQRRRQGTVLQHGSILLERSPVAPELPGILELRGVQIEAPALASAWRELLQRRWAMAFEPDELKPSELATAVLLQETKYAAEPWLQRR